MRIHNYVPKHSNLQPFKERAADFEPNLSRSGVIDYENAPWEEYAPGKPGLDKQWIDNTVKPLRELNGDFIDIVAFGVPEKHWQAGSVVGWHLGNRVHDYEVIQYELRDNWVDTAFHEVMHTVDDFVYQYLGYRLNDVVGFEGDWDEVVVHAQGDEFTEYEWQDVADEVAPHVKKAIDVRRGRMDKGQMSRVLANIRGRLLQMQRELREVKKN